MIKKVLMSITLLVFASTNLTGNYTLNCLAANDYKLTDSPYRGSYSGPYTVEAGIFGEQTGRFTLSRDADGKVAGKAENHTTGRRADMSGSVNEDGDIKLLLEWSDATYTVKGTVTKTKSGHLKGTLNQYSGKEVIATITMDLSPR